MKYIIGIDPGTQSWGVGIVAVDDEGGIWYETAWETDHHRALGWMEAASRIIDAVQRQRDGLQQEDMGAEVVIAVEAYRHRAISAGAEDVAKCAAVIEWVLAPGRAVPFERWRGLWGTLVIVWQSKVGLQMLRRGGPTATGDQVKAAMTWANCADAGLEHAWDAVRLAAAVATEHGGRRLEKKNSQGPLGQKEA